MSTQHQFVSYPKAVPFAGLVAPVAPLAEAIAEGLGGVFAWFGRLATALADRHRERRTMDVLASLNDHTLRDIGIHRSEIEEIAHHLVRLPGVDYRACKESRSS